MAPLFTFEDVSVLRGDTAVLADVCAEVPESGITVVVGPSGCGKTTLLRLCNRLDVPTSGRVRYRGNDLADLDPLRLRREVALVFQRSVALGATLCADLRVAVPEASDAELRTVLSDVGLALDLDRSTDGLSGGELARLGLARALLTEPDVLLLDEPTASIDSVSGDAVERAVLARTAGGTPVVWVTHDVGQAIRVGNQAVVFRDGAVECDLELVEQVDMEQQEGDKPCR